MAKDDYKGEDREGRVNYDKFKEAKKAIKGPEYKNLLQQFSDLMKKAPKGKKSPNEIKKAALDRAAKNRRSKIPASPTR